MPNGYTAGVHDGSVTELEDFIKICAEAFYRGDHTTYREPDTEYEDSEIAKAEMRLIELADMTPQEVQVEAHAEYKKACATTESMRERSAVIRQRYLNMIEKVEAWPELYDDLTPLKEFMIEQLQKGMEWDVHQWDMPDEAPYKPDAWLQSEIESCQRTLDRCKEARENVIERCAKRNRWIRLLREAMENG